ncbi:MAG: hypothetical protein CMB80_21165 [Flammeovirgaceae bacterium]|nr:hypothetical protein [Flammeovirgaceae bacterium]MBE61712.1 hypothetical protein [Flammeovirgaceae bacterium]HCX20270.1 DUF1080 domain-containing protein [Cytophagales bacterium]|tara:strand:- start:3028 stop:3786 length:759 start_codon:yes stop_codon:yes gene_type:complete
MNKTFTLFSIIILSGITCFSQEEQMKPSETEVWEPVPEVVTPGIGTEAPSDAIILFGGNDDFDKNWIVPDISNWYVKDNVLCINAQDDQLENIKMLESKQSFGDIQLHVEWKAPTEIKRDGQRRGNSGIFLMGKYEIQVLDNYENRTYSNGQAASVYKQTIPLVNACRKPGEWQTYDIIFTAPRFDIGGNVESPAYVTVIHNGVLVQNHTEIRGPIKFRGYPRYEPHAERLPLRLQDHGDAVNFRNIWVREL